MRIFDADEGTRELPAKEVGEICVRGAAADDRLLEPARRDRASCCAITSIDGVTRRWLHTGDLGYLDEDGYLFIVDRKKDLIKTSGYQVWPREIEEALAAHPAVAEVGVAGVPDATKGEAVKAWVVLRAGTDGRPRRTCARSAARRWRRTRCRRRSSSAPSCRRPWSARCCGASSERASRGRDGQDGQEGRDGQDGRMGGVATALIALALIAPHVRADVDRYEVYAVRFATLANFPVSSLVAGADRSRRMDIAMMIWVLKGVDGRIAIVDSGFHREQYFTQFTVKDYIKPSEAIAPLGIKPDDVTDLLLTHMHWDHAGGIDLFPKARVWVQKDEYDYYTGEAWQSARTHGGIDADDVLEIVKRNTEGKVSFVRGDDDTSLSGITFGVGGKHTFASQFVVVSTRPHDGRDRVGQHVPLRKHGRARADRADARRGVEPAHAGSDEIAGERAAPARARPRPGGVRPLPPRLRPHRPH